jgi:hypothetical protein
MLSKLKNTYIEIDLKQVQDAIQELNEQIEVEKDVASNLETMKAIARQDDKIWSKKLSIKFLCNPIEIKGNGGKQIKTYDSVFF